ncbi:hypothetical protein [Tenacibaculum aestuarii]|uniref:hypothetical protein n=1 Tax=Tenacibaculum aestuarii TaxID=362781 RepID=UPI0038932F26
MKTTIFNLKHTSSSILLLFILGFIFSNSSLAQNQTFLIHEDQVLPSKQGDYVAVSKEFITLCKENNFPEPWKVAQMNDGKFLIITSLKNFADLDKNPMEDLAKKVGKEKFGSYFEKFNQCYDNHGSYVIILNNELSYMPDGLTITQEGLDYRKWFFMDVSAKNKSEFKEKMKEIKDLFVDKKSKMHYRVYESGFGQVGDRFVVVISAKDGLDYAQKSEENRNLLGNDFKLKFDHLYSLLSNYSEISGRMRPDLSYTPKK